MSNGVLTPEAIAKALDNIPRDGSSWLIPNRLYEYHRVIDDIIFALTYDTGWEKVSSNQEKIRQLKEWKDGVPDWEAILKRSDVAMFPPCLLKLKRCFMVEYEMDYCETVNRLSWLAVHDDNGVWYHNILEGYRAEYGVFRFRCVVGDNLFKLLRRHLRCTLDEFESVYGPGLHDDHCFCDDLLIEMLVSGHLRGAVRAYKIEREYSF